MIKMIKNYKKFNESKFGDGFSIRDEFDKLKSMANEYISMKLKKLLEFVSEIEDLMIIREDDYNIEHTLCNLRFGRRTSSHQIEYHYLSFDTKENTIRLKSEFDDFNKLIEFTEDLDDCSIYSIYLDIDIGKYGFVAERSIIEKIIGELESRYEYIKVIKREISDGRIIDLTHNLHYVKLSLKFKMSDL